jgi:hypothetical protein
MEAAQNSDKTRRTEHNTATGAVFPVPAQHPVILLFRLISPDRSYFASPLSAFHRTLAASVAAAAALLI